MSVLKDHVVKPGYRNTAHRTPFDRALELRALREAAEVYAGQRGKPGSASYRSAWLTFRRRIRSMEDLRRWRASAARRGRPAPDVAPTNETAARR